MGRLDGKVAIITGGAKGIGEADARLFVAEGANVVITDVDVDNGKKLAEELGDQVMFLEHDVREEDQWVSVIKTVVDRLGRLDVLVNNAGVVEIGNIETTTAEAWRFVNAVSADGTFFGCKHAIAAMRDSGGGSIVNMSSIAAMQGESYVTAYCAAKGAVEALSRAVAVYCAQTKTNIRCNSVHPAGIQTPMVADIPQKMMDAGMFDDSQPGVMPPASGIGEPNDVAYMVLYLASDESKFVNGTKMVVDNTVTVTSGSVPE
jgi:3(or 17)beta-hydroxysteroid dehydrogenase